MIILFSPPATGKTYLVRRILQTGIKIVYLSPLKAILLELQDKIKEWGYQSETLTRGGSGIGTLFDGQADIILGIPETIGFNFCVGKNGLPNTLILLDEVHLFQYWGESFRPKMWESLVSLINAECPIIGLSATWDIPSFESFRSKLEVLGEPTFTLNLGNQRLKKYPRKTVFLKNYLLLFFHLLKEIFFSKNRVLLFCRTRKEVFSLSEKLELLGVNVLSCVGGETTHFRKLLQRNQQVRAIVSTSALSHGVNLPSFQTVYITYDIENPDIFLQMVGRGGRRGEEFKVILRSCRFKSLLLADNVAINAAKN